MALSKLTDYRKSSEILHRIVWLAAFAMLSLSVLLILYLGSHARLNGDDFCHLISGQEYGPWGNVHYWRASLNGSFSFYFLHGLSAPLDTQTPSVFVVIIVVTWLFGLVWLIVAGHRLLGLKRPPLSIAILMAAAVVSYSIYGMLSQTSIYWYSASTRHTLPIAIMTIALAACCAFLPRLQSKLRLVAACAAVSLVSFLVAGLSEVFAVLQLLILTLLLPVIYWIIPPAARRNSLALNLCGWAATVTSLLVMVTAPGVARRLALIDPSPGAPPGEPAILFSNLIYGIHTIFRDMELVTGFAGLLALCLFLVLAFQRPAKISPVRKPFQVVRAPLLLCLLVQLLLLPLVWSNQSDNPQVFGRFSAGYMTIIGAHAFLLAGLAAILLARRRINACLLNKPEYWVAIPITTLTAILVIFGLSQFRAINSQAATFIACSVYVLLLALLWQFHINLQAAGSKRRFLVYVIWVILAKWLCIITIVAMNLAIFGYIFRYSLPFVSFAFVFSGFISGISLAYAISHVNASFPATRAMNLLARGSAIVAIAIGFNGLSNNARNIPQFEQYSQAWDQRHQLVLNKRDSGERLAEVPELAASIPSELSYFPAHSDYWSAPCGLDDPLEKRYRA